MEDGQRGLQELPAMPFDKLGGLLCSLPLYQVLLSI